MSKKIVKMSKKNSSNEQKYYWNEQKQRSLNEEKTRIDTVNSSNESKGKLK